MVYSHNYSVNCQMCGDDPDVTCTCPKSIETTATNGLYNEVNKEKKEDFDRKIKKKRMSRIQSQSMYGGKQYQYGKIYHK